MRDADILLQAVLMVVQDGVCFLSKDLDVLYTNPAMEFWYGNGALSGDKCYKVYHGRDCPCDNCPALRSIRTKQLEDGEQFYEKRQKKSGWQRIFCVPILDDLDEVSMIIEYVRDETDEKKLSLSKEFLQTQIETLTDLVAQKDAESKQREQLILGNMDRSVNRVLKYLSDVLDQDSCDMVKAHFDLARMGTEQNSRLALQLTGQELEIAGYIVRGYMSKEIADKMNLSKKAVDYHRSNLRKKLQLKPEENCGLRCGRCLRKPTNERATQNHIIRNADFFPILLFESQAGLVSVWH